MSFHSLPCVQSFHFQTDLLEGVDTSSLTAFVEFRHVINLSVFPSFFFRTSVIVSGDIQSSQGAGLSEDNMSDINSIFGGIAEYALRNHKKTGSADVTKDAE